MKVRKTTKKITKPYLISKFEKLGYSDVQLDYTKKHGWWLKCIKNKKKIDESFASTMDEILHRINRMKLK